MNCHNKDKKASNHEMDARSIFSVQTWSSLDIQILNDLVLLIRKYANLCKYI